MTGAILALLVAVALLAWWVTGLLRAYALRRRMVDVPGARSSHHVTTPRGGGGSIAVVTTVVLAVLALVYGGGDAPMSLVVLIAGFAVAAVGFVDDHGHLSPSIRLIGHCAAATVAVVGIGGAPHLTVLGAEAPGWVAGLLAVLFVVWLLNLTNFMDGIDGLAGIEVLSTCAVGAALYLVVLPGGVRWIEPALLGAATAGFLVWNWPPARIFMGDVGSGYVGFMVAVFTLRAAWAAPALGWAWVILFGVFVVDATVTLLHRGWRREPVFRAHRSHAYQHLTTRWQSHRAVTLLVLCVNLAWLGPIAWLVGTSRLDAITGVVIAYVPLIIGAAALGAGRVQRAVLG